MSILTRSIKDTNAGPTILIEVKEAILDKGKVIDYITHNKSIIDTSGNIHEHFVTQTDLFLQELINGFSKKS